MEKIITNKMDAVDTIFFERELERIKAKTYDIKYPALKAVQVFPVSTDAGPHAESITYRQWDQRGIAKIIANYADDLPRVDVGAKEYTSPIKAIGAAYGYSIQDIRTARALGKPLKEKQANTARRAHDQSWNSIAWRGDVSTGLNGLFTDANVTKTNAAVGTWSTATPDEIIYDINSAFADIIARTKGVANPDTVLIPPWQYAHISTTPRSSLSDTTILEFILRTSTYIKSIEMVNELASVEYDPIDNPGDTDNCMFIYEKSPDILTLEIPQPFEQFPVQERNLEFVVNTHSRIGGLIIYYPLEVELVYGI